jgi:hypothetical protein
VIKKCAYFENNLKKDWRHLQRKLQAQSRTQSMPVRRLGAGHDLICERAYSGYEIASSTASTAP